MNGDAAGASQPEIVLLIHGTNSNDPDDDGSGWWQRGSDFWSRFNEKLGPRFVCQPPGRVFHWSGLNLESNRRAAAAELAAWLTEFEEQQRPYHLIGHSHGGSVIWLALQKASKVQPNLAHLRS